MQIPSQFRRLMTIRMSEDEPRMLVMTEGPDGCVMVLTPVDWGNYMEDMLKLDDMDDDEHLDLMREVLSVATNVTVDSQWRVKLPTELAAFARLDKQVEIHGHMDRIEIWDTEVRKEYMSKKTFDKNKIVKRLYRPKLRKQSDPNEQTDK
ncbi:hypothetical protein HQ587_01065 [bacterium]|nr:hypothetical protein [bacterium]